MNCQKCRQPLRLDGSLEDLNPAAYDVLVSSTSPQTLKKSSVPNPPIAQSQEQARKSLYDRVSRNAGPPTFKRNHGGHPRDSSMSFVLLSESQMTQPNHSPEPPPAPAAMRRASSSRSNTDKPDALVGNEMDRINRLFEILSARSDIDHPICVECTEMLVEGLQKKLEVASRERDAYVKHLKETKANKPSEQDIKAQEEALRKAELDRAAAMEELKKLELDKTSLDEELVALEEESRQLDKEEEKFWRERNEFATKMAEFQAERDSINAKYSNDSQLLEKLQRSNVYNDTFCISHDGSFATINGLRLGRLSNKPVDWPEINAAWGHALLLLVTVADKLAYRFDGYDPQPMGSTSRIIRYEVPSPSSSRLGSRAVNAPPKKHVLELYSSGDMPLGLTFMHRRFDNAMVGFLELVRQLGAFVHRQTDATGSPLSLPYKIDGDKIGDVSIKLGIAQDDGWTKACKLTLTCCCLDAPEYAPGDSADTFYCSRECQTEDWPNHKKKCNNLKRRKSLVRAVKLLKATFIAYREVMFDLHVTKIKTCGRALVVAHDRKRLGWPAGFPGHLISNSEHKEAVLVKSMAWNSLSLLVPMTRTVLAGEEWVIDITGRQFGMQDALLPFQKYMTQNSCIDIKDPEPYDHTEISQQDKLLTMLPPPWFNLEPSKGVIREKGHREHFTAFIREHVDNSLLQGSDIEFAAKIDIFVEGCLGYVGLTLIMEPVQIQHVQSFEDDDTSSMASFEDVPVRHRPRNRRAMSPRPRQDILKVDGKVPDVVHVIKYIGWRDNVVECHQSTQPFEKIPPYGSYSGFNPDKGEDSIGIEKPVLEIVTRVLPKGLPSPRPLLPPPGSSRHQDDRPITEAFEHVDYRYDGLPDEDLDREMAGPEVTKPVMVVHSEHLINALKAVVVYYPYINFDGKPVKINAPYRVLYHHRQELSQYKHRQPSTHSPEYVATTAEHIDVLLKFLDENLGHAIRREEECHQLPTPKATFDLFWLLLKPGEVFYAKRHDIWTPYVISSVTVGQGSSNPYDAYKIRCWMLESNGTKVNRYMSSFRLSQWLGEQAIGSLSIIPAAFWPEDFEAQGGMTMREKNIALGKLYWELLKRPTYMDYEGHLVNSGASNRQCRGPTGFMCGRVICDASGFDTFYNQGPDVIRGGRYDRVPRYNETAPPARDHLPRDLPRCGCDACMDDRSGQSVESPYSGFEDLDPTQDSPPDNDIFYLVSSKTIPGFVLGERRWGHLSVANLKQVETDKEAFKYLVLDDEIKMTVKALIGKFATNLGEGKVAPWGNDFVKNKGEGRIFLLHGAPGVGKTCTAECIAELTNRPLISLTSGDLSVDSYTVESNLSYFLELGQRYGALVLLDEADIYLERRRSKDIMRNGLVSVFLRALEYYRGVLFLTTNRVQSFDSAFLSRIHVALHYKSLSHEDRERIWTYTFDRLINDSNNRIHVSGAAREFVWNSQEARSLKWNGREIRNAMQTALALAENEAEEEHMERITISEKHLRAVVKMSRGFRDYIKTAVPVEGFEDTLNDSDDDLEY
ncbi:hypothetical protein FGRMN_547 [Fusarium graminum]|nr:hypothetical protein FGRMN_547 [Fusarium graminum]